METDMLPPTKDSAQRYPQFTSLDPTNLGILSSPAHPARCTPWANGRMEGRCTITIRLSIVGIQVCSDLGSLLASRAIDA